MPVFNSDEYDNLFDVALPRDRAHANAHSTNYAILSALYIRRLKNTVDCLNCNIVLQNVQ